MSSPETTGSTGDQSRTGPARLLRYVATVGSPHCRRTDRQMTWNTDNRTITGIGIPVATAALGQRSAKNYTGSRNPRPSRRFLQHKPVEGGGHGNSHWSDSEGTPNRQFDGER